MVFLAFKISKMLHPALNIETNVIFVYSFIKKSKKNHIVV